MGSVGSASAEKLRRIEVRPVERREEQQGGGDDPTAKNRQRDVSESLSQLCSCVPPSP